MKANIKRLFLTVLAFTLIISTVVVAGASSYDHPAEIVAELTNQKVEDVITERHDKGITYGTIAKNHGKLTEFQEKMLSLKESQLKDAVKAGTLTKEESEEILKAIKNHQAFCDGLGGGYGSYRTHHSGQGVGRGHHGMHRTTTSGSNPVRQGIGTGAVGARSDNNTGRGIYGPGYCRR